MQTVKPWMFARSDTMLGVCQSLGEDFGINPNWLRVAFAVAVIFNMEYAIAAYAALGVVVLASRLIFRTRRTAQVAAPVVASGPVAPVTEAAEPVIAREPELAVAA